MYEPKPVDTVERVHVVPLNDLRRHIERGISCPCAPSLREGGRMVVHNSFDGREFFESGNQDVHKDN
jgi:hypothetical protein